MTEGDLPGFTLDAVPGLYAICRLEPYAMVPAWATRGVFCSVTRTPTELSVVCDASGVPSPVRSEGPWRALAVRGPLDFNLTGVLASLTGPLAEAGISLFAVATFDTDYVLVRAQDFDRALHTLVEAGHRDGAVSSGPR